MGEMVKRVTLYGRRKKLIRALIDTGSSTSYLRYDIAKYLGLPFGEKVRVEDESGIAQGYKSSALVSFGGNYKTAIALVIVERQYFPLMIGQDFLQREDIVIDFRRDVIKIAKKYRRRRYYR